MIETSNFAPLAALQQNPTLEFAPSHTHDGAQSQNNAGAPAAKMEQLDALVIGASWAGIWLLHKLREAGFKARLWDACADVGGVWWYTQYPGCRVDTEVPFYAFSMPQLWQKWNWTQRFPSREEIHSYLRWVCEELELVESMTFNKRVSAAQWNDGLSDWTVSAADGSTVNARFLLPCVGYSTIHHMPDIEGLDKFQECYHTSAWPKTLAYRNKRVGVIGTGASAIQIIEALGKEVEHLTVFQRTPNLATPMRQEGYSVEAMARMKESFPERLAGRYSRHGFDMRCTRSSWADSSQEREEFYETLWEKGGLAFWLGNYRDTLDDNVSNARAYAFWRSKVRQRLQDPVKAEILAPIKPPHAFGTKRPSLETNYWETFNRSNVELVDVNSDPIVEVSEAGIITASGKHHNLDILALATGFDFLTGSMLAMNIRGKNNTRLEDRWDIKADGKGTSTYLGLSTAGFPNLLFPMGPQAPSALGLTPQLAEVQGDWVSDLLSWMQKHDKSTVEPTVKAEETWKDEVNRAASKSLFGQTDSWYMGVNIPGRKKQPLCYFGGVDKYMDELAKCTADGYKGFSFR